MSNTHDTYADTLEVVLSALDTLCRDKLAAADAALIDPAVDAYKSGCVVAEGTGVTEAYMVVSQLLNAHYRAQVTA